MRIPLIVANWKMNHTLSEALYFLMQWQKEFQPVGNREVVVCPAFTALYSVSVTLSEDPAGMVKLGAQNCHFEASGAYTGEISPVFLKELQCDYVILGHSERRTLFGESNALLEKKVPAVLAHQMTPIFCVGETDAERVADKTFEVIERQLSEGLKTIEKNFASGLVVAYEPVWAIGTGKNAQPHEAQAVHVFIRDWLGRHINRATAEQTRILYGGSVKPENMASFMKQKDIDGALVGGASLKVDSFAGIVNY